MRRLILAFALFVSSWRPSKAMADAPHDATLPATLAEARVRHARGVSLAQAKAWDAALAEFMASSELNPAAHTPKINAALCLQALHRFDEAMDMYEGLLRDFAAKLAPEKALEIRDRLTALSSFVGTVMVVAQPGASMVIDGRVRGVAPLPAPLRVATGTHVVRVYMQGFVPFESRVEVVGGRAVTVTAQLQPLKESGTLKVVEARGRELDVVVDAIAVGKTPWEGSMAVGDHAVLLRGPEHVGSQPVSAPVHAARVTAVTLLAEPLPGVLRVEPLPGGASVAVDGVLVGHGTWRGRLRLGSHRIEVAAEGFLPFLGEVTVVATNEVVVAATLERDPSSALWRAENPSHYFVEVDGAASFTMLYGGDIVDECAEGCSTGMPPGAFAVARAGYRAGSRLGVSIDAGYLSMRRSVSQRATRAAVPMDTGRADDTLRVRGLMLGASAALHGSGRFPVQLRLGLGALVAASAIDHVVFASESAAPAYEVESLRSARTAFAYLAPEVRVGMNAGSGWELSLGVQAMVLFALSSTSTALPDQRTATDFVSFDARTITGGVMFVLAPGLGARYRF